jgi:hypothetical protein
MSPSVGLRLEVADYHPFRAVVGSDLVIGVNTLMALDAVVFARRFLTNSRNFIIFLLPLNDGFLSMRYLSRSKRNETLVTVERGY